MKATRRGLLCLLATLACASLVGCTWKKKAAGLTPSSSSASPNGSGPAGAKGPPVPLDPLRPADRAMVDRTKDAVRELDTLVNRGVLTDSAKPGEGDLVMRCASIESTRPRLETLPDADGDLQTLVAETRRLCSLEVPILNANHTLRQVSISPSQASRRLMCGFAQKDFAKARAAKPNDRRLLELGQRLRLGCS